MVQNGAGRGTVGADAGGDDALIVAGERGLRGVLRLVIVLAERALAMSVVSDGGEGKAVAVEAA